jgi:hypothetical protein
MHRPLVRSITNASSLPSSDKFFSRNASGALRNLTTRISPRVTHTPTLTGGLGADQLRRFYEDFFITSNPSSLRLRLLSRTIGSDRVVDELYMSFKHSQPMPWILPGIPATNRQVEIVVVSIVCVRGGKLYSEHVYWDQASILLQAGLLDPKLVPEKMRKQGVRQLPIVGRDAARRILKGDGGKGLNELVPGWEAGVNQPDPEEDDEVEEEEEEEEEEEGLEEIDESFDEGKASQAAEGNDGEAEAEASSGLEDFSSEKTEPSKRKKEVSNGKVGEEPAGGKMSPVEKGHEKDDSANGHEGRKETQGAHQASSAVDSHEEAEERKKPKEKPDELEEDGRSEEN